MSFWTLLTCMQEEGYWADLQPLLLQAGSEPQQILTISYSQHPVYIPLSSSNTSGGLGSTCSGGYQTLIPEGSEVRVIKPLPASGTVLKLDHSTSSEWIPVDSFLF